MEVISSFFNNIKDKLTNPFFGTLILVLIFHHWDLWYTIFNFDKDCNLIDKKLIINEYLHTHLTFCDFLSDIGIAFGSMTIGYLLVIVTRSLVMLIEFNLMPTITKKIINKKVVLKSDFDLVAKERGEYFNQYEEQRRNVRIFSKSLDEQTENIKLKNEELISQSTKISDLLDKNEKLMSELNEKKTELNDCQRNNKELLNEKIRINSILDFELIEKNLLNEILFSEENTSFFKTINDFPPFARKAALQLINDIKVPTFFAVANYLEKGGSTSMEAVTEMANRGLVFYKGKNKHLTPLGKFLYKYRNALTSDIE